MSEESHQPYTVKVVLKAGTVDEFDTVWHTGVGRCGNLNINLFTPEKGMTHVVYAPGTWTKLVYA